jgi:hypothetical protein
MERLDVPEQNIYSPLHYVKRQASVSTSVSTFVSTKSPFNKGPFNEGSLQQGSLSLRQLLTSAVLIAFLQLMSTQSRTYLTVVALTLAFSFSQAQRPAHDNAVILSDSTVRSSDVVVSIWKHPHVTVVEVPDTLVFCYLPRNEAPLDSIARREKLRCVINGSFFEGARGNASHAGWLWLYGLEITPVMDDRQLTHVVRNNSTHRTIEFLPARSFEASNDPRVIEFQTGPLIIENGRIREDLIRASINGSSKHTRTLLATLDHRRCFFITVTDRVTLAELADTLLRLTVLRGGRLDVVNLDGGSSVALYLRDIPGLNSNADDRLPIVIGFH